MNRIKLTKPGFEKYTGTLLGIRFVNGLSEDISEHDRDMIAASQGSVVLVDESGEEVGDAHPTARWTHSKPTDPRAPYLGVPVDRTPDPEEEPVDPEDPDLGGGDGEGGEPEE